MKNSGDQGGCYPQRPKAEVDNALRYLRPSKAEFNNCFIIHSKYFPVLKRSFATSLFVFPLTKFNTTLSPGFLRQRFNKLERAALLTSFCLTSSVQSFAAGCTFDVIGSIFGQ